MYSQELEDMKEVEDKKEVEAKDILDKDLKILVFKTIKTSKKIMILARMISLIS